MVCPWQPLLESAERVEDAEAALKTALNIDPSQAKIHNQLGVIYQKLGNIPAARTAYESAIVGKYQHAGVFCNLGVVYAEEGLYEKAQRAYQLAIKLKPDLAIAHYHLENLFQKSGNASSALTHYQAFLRYWKDDPHYLDEVRERIHRLDPSA